MQPENEFSALATAATIFLCILFGSNAVAVKMAFEGLGVFTSAAVRFSVAAVAIYVWAKFTGQPLGLKNGQIHQMMILAALFWAQISLFYLGIDKSNASRGTLLANLLPFFVLFLAHFFIPDDRITIRKLFGILLGFSGVIALFMENQGATSDFRRGDLLILAATFLWSVNVVYLKLIIHRYNSFQIVLYNMLFSMPLFYMGAFLWDHAMISRLDAKVLTALAYQSIITASFGFVMWNNLMQKYGAVALHSFVFLMPIAGVALGGLMLGEPVTPKILLALGLIVSGILVVHWRPKKAAPAYPIRRGF